MTETYEELAKIAAEYRKSTAKIRVDEDLISEAEERLAGCEG